MPVITRTALTVTSPIPGEGSAFNSSNSTSGNGTVQSSSDGGGGADEDEKSCRWSNFGAPVSGQITKIELKYDWSWSTEAHTSVDDLGFGVASAGIITDHISGSSGTSSVGPGPINNDDTDSDSGSEAILFPANTDLSTIALEAIINSQADSGTTGHALGQASIVISNIKVEITVSPSVSGIGFAFAS